MSDEPLTYYYNPDPQRVEDALPEAGVTAGWVVVCEDIPGDAHMAEASMLVDGEGGIDVVMRGDFQTCRIIDDDEQPNS